ncbi:BROMO [Musa troglodytarum]|uniref:BROMO n=1 Tax=Musa troglodytarum TaxID=320322 RepID=A0A9E7KQY4_9LILI|nr:BROMO [Musa troglodytarum]
MQDDVFLICTNAMQYNGPDTIYFRQARTMQDIGRKEFQKLRTEGKCIETVSKCEEKIRPDSTEKKLLQKCLPKVVQESFVSDISSATTHPSGGDPCIGLSTAEASGAEPASASNGLADGSCSLGDSKSEKVDDLRVKGSPSKLKSLDVDENRRATYNACDQQPATESGTVYDVLEGKQRQLVPVGLDAEYSYARSLARFAGNLGPIAWRIASQRIESALPSGVKFGSGWVAEYEPLPTTILFLENNNQLQQCQLDSNTSSQSNMPSRDKGTAAGRKASDNDHSKEVNFGIQSQVGTRSYSSRSSDPMKEGNNLCGITQVKRQSSSVTSKTQQRGNAAMLRQQKEQVTFDLAKASGTFEQVHERQLSCSNSRLVSQALQRPEINTGVANFKSPGNISLGRKPMQHEPLRQTEAMVPCSTPDGRVNVDQFSHGKVLENSSTNSLNNTTGFVSKSRKGIVGNDRRIFGSHEHGLSDPSRLMGLPIKMFNQSNIANSSVDSSKLLPSTVPPAGTESSITADAASAHSWMSVGNSLQSKLSVDPVNVRDNPNGSASTYFIGSSWRTPTLSPRNSDNSRTTSMPQALRQPIQVVGLEPQVHNKGLVIFPQLIATDMPRFQGQAPWQGLLPQTENKHTRNTCPPDLNISFQPPGSPVRHSSGIVKDSQQPDLALQL